MPATCRPGQLAEPRLFAPHAVRLLQLHKTKGLTRKSCHASNSAVPGTYPSSSSLARTTLATAMGKGGRGATPSDTRKRDDAQGQVDQADHELCQRQTRPSTYSGERRVMRLLHTPPMRWPGGQHLVFQARGSIRNRDGSVGPTRPTLSPPGEFSIQGSLLRLHVQDWGAGLPCAAPCGRLFALHGMPLTGRLVPIHRSIFLLRGSSTLPWGAGYYTTHCPVCFRP